MSSPTEAFHQRNARMIQKMGQDRELEQRTHNWFEQASKYEYSYHFTWMGRPIIQFPQDMVALQEIIWETRPQLIVETGVAHGGSLIFHASLLELIGGNGRVLGIDIDIRPHNRAAIESHPMFKRIILAEGSSTAPEMQSVARQMAADCERVMVILDSNHTHEHVRAELDLYGSLVTRGCYLVVLDTIIDRMGEAFSNDRPWGPGRSPLTAVQEFLKTSNRFVLNSEIDNKLLITVAPGGYLKCIKD